MQQSEPHSPTSRRRTFEFDAQHGDSIVLEEIHCASATNPAEHAISDGLRVAESDDMFDPISFSSEEVRPLIDDVTRRNDGENGNKSSLALWQLVGLYASHSLSMWNSRCYEFAAV